MDGGSTSKLGVEVNCLSTDQASIQSNLAA